CMVTSPADYKWSSYGAHACGQPDNLLERHPCYLDLGKDDQARQEAYRALFRHDVDSALMTIREAANSGLALGGERFKDQIEAVLARSVRAGKPGRPRKRDIETARPVEATLLMDGASK
ncbi:MAG: hypothetical protein ACOY3Z_05710, partial [Thermodesulfobacteriota bacterium]